MVIATFGRFPSPSASTTSAGTSAPVALPAGTTVERKLSAGNVLPLRDAVELPRPWLGERDVAVAVASSLGDAQFEEHVPVVRCVARGLGCDRPEMRRVDPFTAASDVELASRAVGVGYEALQGVHAAANDVVALGRGRLHEQEESSVSDDRRHGVDAGGPASSTVARYAGTAASRWAPNSASSGACAANSLHGTLRRWPTDLCGTGIGQLTAFFTRARILASHAAVSSLSAKDVGHMAPSSRLAASSKPNVAYRDLNLSALLKKQTTLPSFAYAGIPYQVFGARRGAEAVTIAWSRSAMARSGAGISAIFASTSRAPSAFCPSAFSSRARSLIAARSSAVKPDDALPFLVPFVVVAMGVLLRSVVRVGRTDSITFNSRVLVSSHGDAGEDASGSGRGRRRRPDPVP